VLAGCPDIGGPQVRSAQDLAGAYLRASGRHRLVLPARLPGAVFPGYRQGGHLAPERAVGQVTFEEFLAERIPASRLGRTDVEQAMTMRTWPWLRAALVLLTLTRVNCRHVAAAAPLVLPSLLVRLLPAGNPSVFVVHEWHGAYRRGEGGRAYSGPG
jgi:hypothetical protein